MPRHGWSAVSLDRVGEGAGLDGYRAADDSTFGHSGERGCGVSSLPRHRAECFGEVDRGDRRAIGDRVLDDFCTGLVLQ
jgi:hypothetical protein